MQAVQPKETIYPVGISQKGFEHNDLVCLSHLRWNFVFQRPQHLLSRCANDRRVFFFEEPEFHSIDKPVLRIVQDNTTQVWVVTPQLPHGLEPELITDIQRVLLDDLLRTQSIKKPVLWYYTPMALPFSDHVDDAFTVFDCMDELSAFAGAPAALKQQEQQLLKKADVVFTGGQSLYKAKSTQHGNVHAFPSSVDVPHFAQAKLITQQPDDQDTIPYPRLGFYGVIDERFDIALLQAMAEQRPDWHFVMLGPVVKIDPATLPQNTNIHWLGSKTYAQLPGYIAGWQVALLPFAHNESTKFISPTKTPEYLAAGKPVVSTSIQDVVEPYGQQELVRIADSATDFIAACEAALSEDAVATGRQARIDAFLAHLSWDKTWGDMAAHINQGVRRKASQKSERPLPPSRSAGDNNVYFFQANRPFDYVIVGAGFAGAVLAERLAADGDKKVLVVDKRAHIAGNAYDHYDENGILVHKYGPHIFHTNSGDVFDYLSQFTQWHFYEHKVLAEVNGKKVPMPINLNTINTLYDLNLTSEQMDAFLAERAEPCDQVRTSEDVVVGKVGRELYNLFFRGYTRKQWGIDPSELDASVTARVPTRTNTDDRYFTDKYQFMPAQGFTHMFENMLKHPNIKVMLNTDYREIINFVPYHEMIYTGPVDAFFDYRYGKLPYRSLEFKHETLDTEQVQPVAVINYPNDHDYTRVTEFKHLTGQQHAKTSVVYEYPQAEGDPYYPVPRPENAKLYNKYKLLADAMTNVHFVGRLATYRYYNMDQVVAQALTLYNQLKQKPELPGIKQVAAG